MFKIGYAQEIITPPTGVGLAGYFNKRPNQGMYDDLYVKVVMIESGSKKFGFMTFDLCNIAPLLFQKLEKLIVEKFGRKLSCGKRWAMPRRNASCSPLPTAIRRLRWNSSSAVCGKPVSGKSPCCTKISSSPLITQ